MSQEDRNIETLLGLLENYSPSGSEGDAVNWLVRHMGTLDFTRSYVDDVGNAVGVMGEGDRQIMLLGHIDTVPGRNSSEYLGNRKRCGYLRSRGS